MQLHTNDKKYLILINLKKYIKFNRLTLKMIFILKSIT